MTQEEIKKQVTEEITGDDVNATRGMGLSYYKISSITPGEPAVLEITSAVKVRNPKYPIRGLDYAYRFTLGNGQVMDISSRPVAGELIRLGFGQGDKFHPFKVKISRKPVNKIGETPYILDKA